MATHDSHEHEDFETADHDILGDEGAHEDPLIADRDESVAAAAAPAPVKKKKNGLFVIGGIAIVGLSLAGFAGYKKFGGSNDEPAPQIAVRAPGGPMNRPNLPGGDANQAGLPAQLGAGVHPHLPGQPTAGGPNTGGAPVNAGGPAVGVNQFPRSAANALGLPAGNGAAMGVNPAGVVGNPNPVPNDFNAPAPANPTALAALNGQPMGAGQVGQPSAIDPAAAPEAPKVMDENAVRLIAKDEVSTLRTEFDQRFSAVESQFSGFEAGLGGLNVRLATVDSSLQKIFASVTIKEVKDPVAMKQGRKRLVRLLPSIKGQPLMVVIKDDAQPVQISAVQGDTIKVDGLMISVEPEKLALKDEIKDKLLLLGDLYYFEADGSLTTTALKTALAAAKVSTKLASATKDKGDASAKEKARDDDEASDSDRPAKRVAESNKRESKEVPVLKDWEVVMISEHGYVLKDATGNFKSVKIGETVPGIGVVKVFQQPIKEGDPGKLFIGDSVVLSNI